MMPSLGKVLTFLLAPALCACANTEATLRNDKGEQRYCYLVHRGGEERVVVSDRFNKCLNDAGAAGYRRVDRRVDVTPSF